MIEQADPKWANCSQKNPFAEQEDRAAKLAAIVESVSEEAGFASATNLGPLSLAPALYGDEASLCFQIRSQPLPEFAGGEFRFDVPENLMERAALTDALLDAAWHFHMLREGVEDSIHHARRLVRIAIARRGGAAASVALTAIGMRASPSMVACFDVVVELEALGHGLTPVVHRIGADGRGGLERELDQILSDHDRRAGMIAVLQACGAQGWIEETAQRLATESLLDPAIAIEQLKRRSTFCYRGLTPRGHVCFWLRWREGVLKADFEVTGLYCLHDEVTVFRLLPVKVLASKVARRLGKILKDPLVPEASLVTGFRRSDYETMITLEIPVVPLFL